MNGENPWFGIRSLVGWGFLRTWIKIYKLDAWIRSLIRFYLFKMEFIILKIGFKKSTNIKEDRCKKLKNIYKVLNSHATFLLPPNFDHSILFYSSMGFEDVELISCFSEFLAL